MAFALISEFEYPYKLWFDMNSCSPKDTQRQKELEMNVQALPMHRFIDHHGDLVGQLPNWADTETLVGFYRDMVLTRTYDNKAVALQRTGKLGTYPSHLGAEAIGIAVGRALKADDVFAP